MIALELFQQILGLFFIIMLGFLLVRTKLLKSTDARIISVLVIYIIMPCVIINGFQVDYTPDIMHGFLIAVVIAIIMHALLFLVGAFMKKVLHMNDVERLSVIYMNSANLVYPLVTLMFGEEWCIYISAYFCVQTVFFWTHAQTVMSGQYTFNWRKIVSNVNMIAALIGIIMFLTHFRVTGIPGTVLKNLSAPVGTLSMLMIGMAMGGMDLKAVFTGKKIYIVAFFRLIIGGLLAVAVLKITGTVLDFENEQKILMVILLSLASPSASTIAQLAQFYDNDKEYASAINVLTTLLCVITMPLMMALLEM